MKPLIQSLQFQYAIPAVEHRAELTSLFCVYSTFDPTEWNTPIEELDVRWYDLKSLPIRLSR